MSKSVTIECMNCTSVLNKHIIWVLKVHFLECSLCIYTTQWWGIVHEYGIWEVCRCGVVNSWLVGAGLVHLVLPHHWVTLGTML